MPESLISVEGVAKKFCRRLKTSLWYGLKDLKNELQGYRIGGAGQLRPDEFWVFRDVSFDVKRGECLAMLGSNGAGKTTLLRMLNGLIKPDQGRIEIRGRVGALIALGAGFNPILTGRENIYVNAAVLGWPKRLIDQKIGEIIEFSGIASAIDSPVRNYSSGMHLRLGFAIASHVVPDILLIDEVLAVGDAGFRMKCYNKIYELRDRTAIIVVSHSMSEVGKVCNCGLVLAEQKLFLQKTSMQNVTDTYYRQFKRDDRSEEGDGSFTITEITLTQGRLSRSLMRPWGDTNDADIMLDPDDRITLEVRCDHCSEVSRVVLLWTVSDTAQQLVAQALSPPLDVERSARAIRFQTVIGSLNLNRGRFYLSVHLFHSSRGGWDRVVAGVRNAMCFSISRSLFSGSAPILYDSDTVLADPTADQQGS